MTPSPGDDRMTGLQLPGLRQLQARLAALPRRHRLGLGALAAFSLLLAFAIGWLAFSCTARQGPCAADTLLGGLYTRVADTALSKAAWRLQQAKRNPPELRAFLQRMPKGADLHTHLSGAVYAETFIRLAEQRALCFDTDPAQLKFIACPVPLLPGKPPVAGLNDAGRSLIIAALSMRGDDPNNVRFGHDRFFATFARIGAAGDDMAEMVADVVRRAAQQHVQHIELMVSFGRADVLRLVGQVFGDGSGGGSGSGGGPAPWNGDDLAAMRARLLAAGLENLVAPNKAYLDGVEAARTQLMRCGTAQAEPGCSLSVRYIGQIVRTGSDPQVFGHALFYALMAQQDARLVGLNLVTPEDYKAALDNYSAQMRMIGHLKSAYPALNVALHAGELEIGLVPPEHLRFHITEAVRIARAQRIGHGVAVKYEDDLAGLLREMAERRVAVEINLTSNDVILGLRGAEHPFQLYRRAGVPLAISTDDEGISRIDLTHELERAVRSYDLDYADLVELARNSLEHSFLPGASLWRDLPRTELAADCSRAALAEAETPATLPPDCRRLIEASEKAQLQWRFERALAAFEQAL